MYFISIEKLLSIFVKPIFKKHRLRLTFFNRKYGIDTEWRSHDGIPWILKQDFT
jgi:hypothetical protein